MSQTYTFISPSDAASKPPSGAVPEFLDPFTLQPYWNETVGLSMAICGVLLLLRMYTKIVVVRQCKWEDCAHLAIHAKSQC